VAKADTGARRRRNRRRSSAGLPRGFAVGIVLLVCGGLLAWYYRTDLDTAFTPTADPAATENAESAGRPSKPEAGKVAVEAPPAEDAGRFEFYEMLPDAEVDVPEQPKATGAVNPPPVSVPGTYVVQAGAFPDFAEADKVKARLALLGVESEIQAADANGATFHRVRIGPIDNLDELNRLRARLRQNGIEYLVIPVGE